MWNCRRSQGEDRCEVSKHVTGNEELRNGCYVLYIPDSNIHSNSHWPKPRFDLQRAAYHQIRVILNPPTCIITFQVVLNCCPITWKDLYLGSKPTSIRLNVLLRTRLCPHGTRVKPNSTIAAGWSWFKRGVWFCVAVRSTESPGRTVRLLSTPTFRCSWTPTPGSRPSYVLEVCITAVHALVL